MIIFFTFIEYLQFILQSNVVEISKYCPYLIERAVVAVIRAAMHLIQPEEMNNIATLVWKSMVIIHEVPHEILLCFAERLGSGLVSLVRYIIILYLDFYYFLFFIFIMDYYGL